jgi:hypothetical protein
MHVVHPICCGLDVHPASVVACLRCVGDDGQMRLERREYGTTHSELLGSVANYRKQESLSSQTIDFPKPDFRILPLTGCKFC